MKLKSILSSVLVVIALIVGYALDIFDLNSVSTSGNGKGTSEVADVLYLPSDRFPETAAHIKDAIAKGKTDICTIDRNGASERRKQSLANVPTKKGYDRDEYPMAMCAEGGNGASVRYIKPSDNRGAGSYVGSKVGKLPDGAKFKIVVE